MHTRVASERERDHLGHWHLVKSILLYKSRTSYKRSVVTLRTIKFSECELKTLIEYVEQTDYVDF